MPSIYSGLTTTFDQDYPCLIEKLEIKGYLENASQWVDVGTMDKGAELTIKPKGGGLPMSGGRKHLGNFEVAIKGDLICTGSASRTALALIASNLTDSRWTDRNGRKYTFTGQQVTIVVGEEGKGDGEGRYIFPIEAAGTISPTEWVACVS